MYASVFRTKKNENENKIVSLSNKTPTLANLLLVSIPFNVQLKIFYRIFKRMQQLQYL